MEFEIDSASVLATPIGQRVRSEMEKYMASGQAYMIISVSQESVYYIQFARHETGLDGETVSNYYIKENYKKLSAEAETELEALGWQKPLREGNFLREWTNPLNLEGISRVAALTLANVFKADPNALSVQMFT